MVKTDKEVQAHIEQLVSVAIALKGNMRVELQTPCHAFGIGIPTLFPFLEKAAAKHGCRVDRDPNSDMVDEVYVLTKVNRVEPNPIIDVDEDALSPEEWRFVRNSLIVTIEQGHSAKSSMCALLLEMFHENGGDLGSLLKKVEAHAP